MKKEMTKVLFALPLALLFAFNAAAQSIGPSVLNSTGASTVLGGNTYEWSVGEMTLVNTASGTGIVVTQGLLQPAQITTGVATTVIPENELKVFPIPTSSIINIQPAFANSGVLHIVLLDVAGKNVVAHQAELSSGKELQQIDVAAYVSGNYVLNISFESKGVMLQKSYKILKN